MKPGAEFLPRIVSWNVTYRCNLKCAHCYLDASPCSSDQELTTEEGLKLVEEIASISPGAMLVLSGGEPLLRGDIFTIAKHASSQGLMVVIGTNGVLLDGSTAARLAGSGVKGVGISLDSPTPDFHDRFRGLKGAWEKTIRGIEACRRAGLDFQVQTTVTRGNYDLLPSMVEFARSLGARVFDLFFLVCVGRGQNLSDLSPDQYQSLLEFLLKAQPRYLPMLLRPRCAPYYARLLEQQGQGGPSFAAGCLAGSFYCRVTPEGNLTPCPYLPLDLGNIRKGGLSSLWHTSPQLQELRGGDLGGRCGRCQFSTLCRGCRARALLMKGHLLDEDPWCLYEPRQQGKPQDKRPEEPPHWSPEAAARLERVPFFLRPMVKRAVEARAQRRGLDIITIQLLEEMKPSRRA